MSILRYLISCSSLATTRKLYEKKLLKLKEQGQEPSSFIPAPIVSSSAENNKQNGNNDSDQYSDNEEGRNKSKEIWIADKEDVKIIVYSRLEVVPGFGCFLLVTVFLTTCRR